MARSQPGLSTNLEFNEGLEFDDGDFLDPKVEDTGKSATIGRTTLQRLLRGNSYQEHVRTPTASGNGITRMGSVLSGSVSPVQNFRFGISTVDNGKLLHHDESGREKIMEDIDKEGSVEDVYETYQSSGDEVRRNDAVTDNGGNHARGVSGQGYDQYTGGNSQYSPGDFRFLPYSHTQVHHGSSVKGSEHTPLSHSRREIPEDSGSVPERFRQGRESLSVIRNVTIRESKRPKARSSDQEYQRRCSISPSTLRATLGFQRTRAHFWGGIGKDFHPPSRGIESRHGKGWLECFALLCGEIRTGTASESYQYQ